jgi:hypothetical protein
MTVIKSLLLAVVFFAWSNQTSICYAQSADGLGQSIQIYTQFQSFIGKPSWLLILRDIDHGQVIPYVYDITKNDNFWLAFSYGRNYKITVSQLNFYPYGIKIDNFCGLVDGRIMRGESMYMTIRGDLTPRRRWSIDCHVMRYPDFNFTVVNHTRAD